MASVDEMHVASPVPSSSSATYETAAMRCRSMYERTGHTIFISHRIWFRIYIQKMLVRNN